MKTTVILDTPRCLITSYANGIAYNIQDLRMDKSVLLQGDDAIQFSDELNAGDREWEDICADYSEVMS